MSWSVLSALRQHNSTTCLFLPRRYKHVYRKCLSQWYDVIDKPLPEESHFSCKSHKLMMYNNIIDKCHAGAYHLLPLGVRALEKLIKIIDAELETIGAQKMCMPSLAPATLWKKTDRWNTAGTELFKLKDRHGSSYCLGPTHEELVTDMISKLSTVSYKNLPIMLYQITRKFRDEQAPKFGLLRGREFEMKDMYTFDSTEEKARLTYDKVCDVYCRIFDKLNIKYIKVLGATGNIGGKLSHEFHFPANVGEDTVRICKNCGYGANVEVIGHEVKNCPECKSDMDELTCIEVGHSFLLGTKYSDVFNVKYKDEAGKSQIMEMGCYGLGVTRILQASIEVLSSDNRIRWPQIIAPYQICIIPQKEGYKADQMMNLSNELNDQLNELSPLRGEVVIDDRTKLSIGRRLYLANRLGYPYIIVVGNKALESPGLYEVLNVSTNETCYLQLNELLQLMSNITTV